MTYDVGQLFIRTGAQAGEYPALSILAQVDTGELRLIHLKTGNRWTQNAVRQTNGEQIDQAVFHQEFGTDWTAVPLGEIDDLTLACWIVRHHKRR